MEGEGRDPGEPGRSALEGRPLAGREERAVHDERLPGESLVVALVGREDRPDQIGAVTSAARGDEDERAPFHRLEDLVGEDDVGARLPREVAGEHGLGRHLGGEPVRGHGVVDLGKAVHPDLIVELAERGHDLLALPFLGQGAGIVHDVAQAEDESAASAPPEPPERAPRLAEEPERLLVDEEEVRLEHPRGVLDDRGAEGQRMIEVHVEVQARILAVPQLDDARHADEVHPGAEAEAPDDGRPRQDEDVQLPVLLDEGMGDGPAAPEMTEAERVVTVDEDPVRGERRLRGAMADGGAVRDRSSGRSRRAHCSPCPPCRRSAG